MYGCYHSSLETVIGRCWGVQWPETFIICMGAMVVGGGGQTSICTIVVSIVCTAVSMFVLCTHTKTLDLFLPSYG